MSNVSLRRATFYPSLALLGGMTILALVNSAFLLKLTRAVHEFLMDQFSWLYALSAFALVLVAAGTLFSPIARLRIGGKSAKPILSKWQWCSITLCSSVAIGLLFFAAAEPIFFMSAPPSTMDVEAFSTESGVNGIASLYMHWSFTTYAIYTVPALMFAIAHYNLGMKFSISSAMTAALPINMGPITRQIVDALALIALVAGMVASLGTGAMMLGGGINRLFGIEVTDTLIGALCMIVMLASALSAATGLLKGIRFLSSWNARALVVMAALVLIFGPTSFITNGGIDALGRYLSGFIKNSLNTGTINENGWPRAWTLFFWANWFAWAPVTSMFLGKISRGYSVREFLLFNFIFPASFVLVWCATFGGLSVFTELNSANILSQALQNSGPGDVIWVLLEQLPMAMLFVALFLGLSLVSYVTAADSTIDAISGMCCNGNANSEVNSSPYYIKLVWGAIISIITLVLTVSGGLEALKMISTVGGFIGLLIVMCAAASLVRIACWPTLLPQIKSDILPSPMETSSAERDDV
ncbi:MULTISPECIES: BCCT family transporter [unclassified Halomonas]|uniref:BCCT family transporter n=1 Tax=unclassified Halomonas TaxID=2609666 RepID=UPI00299F86E2|nr:BCCT family transporter [Halomonas sp. S3-1-8]